MVRMVRILTTGLLPFILNRRIGQGLVWGWSPVSNAQISLWKFSWEPHYDLWCFISVLSNDRFVNHNTFFSLFFFLFIFPWIYIFNIQISSFSEISIEMLIAYNLTHWAVTQSCWFRCAQGCFWRRGKRRKRERMRCSNLVKQVLSSLHGETVCAVKYLTYQRV